MERNRRGSEQNWSWFNEEEGTTTCKFIGKHFGIKQSSRVRGMDDCSCCGPNWTVGLREKFQLQSIDIPASMVAEAFESSPNGCLPSTLGRSPVNGMVKLIGFTALPCGTVGSVAGFLRVGLAVWFIGLVALQACWKVFYDGYIVLGGSDFFGQHFMECLNSLRLAELDLCEEGKKFTPFDEKFHIVGTGNRLELLLQRKTTIGHTDDRQTELVTGINDVLVEGWMNAERLRGRMIFFKSYAFDRLPKAEIKNVGRFCVEVSGQKQLYS